MRDESPKDGFLKTKSVVEKWKPTMMTLRRELSFWNSRVVESKLESLLDAVEKVREETGQRMWSVWRKKLLDFFLSDCIIENNKTEERKW